MSRWCILRTNGGQTLPLARSLRESGFDVWTPARTIRRIVKAKTPSGTRQFDIELPILPTFVFARERDLGLLADAAVELVSPHPDFSIFRHGGRIPLVGDGEIAGLRGEEERAAALIQALRDAETREEAERIRIAAIKSEAARRRATRAMERAHLVELRSQKRAFDTGSTVRVVEAPAWEGVTGVVESSDGTFAVVRFGTQSWKIEGWRLSPHDLEQDAA